MKKYFLVIGLFFVLTMGKLNIVFAQQDEPPVSNNPDRKSIGSAKNIVKTDIISIISGELPVSWEHKFSKQIGIEAGAGVLLPYYVNMNIMQWMLSKHNTFPAFTNTKMGFSALFAFNYSFLMDERWSIGPVVHYRQYSGVLVLDYGVQCGYKALFFNLLSVDFGLKMYGLWQKSRDNVTYFYDTSSPFSVLGSSISIKLGYVIN
ncbi:MAG: hypothetical protein LBQ64_04090 [Bacteroidales bacterium]|jgi:hypothetical protein|nr:hypothetical protein [Bacteroidales bacterium]